MSSEVEDVQAQEIRTLEARDPVVRSTRAIRGAQAWRRVRGQAIFVAALIVLFLSPLYLDSFWLNLGGFAFAAAIGAIGLTILYGRVGQLSLAHSFFLSVGAYGYILFAAEGDDEAWGLGLPPVLAAAAAVVLAGAVGLAFSPLSGRLKGISMGVATLALIYIGEYLLFRFPELSGGYEGRQVPNLSIGGFDLVGDEPAFTVAGVTFGRPERLWIVLGVVLLVSIVLASRVVNSRIGRAFVAVRDSEHHATTLGIDVARVRSSGFMVSSVFAGLAGVLLAVAFRTIVPDYWTLLLSLQYLAMVIIGGLGSIRGAVSGAIFVSALPVVLQRYGDLFGLDSGPDAAFPPSVVAQFAFGALIVVVLLADPKGLAHLLANARVIRRLNRGQVERT